MIFCLSPHHTGTWSTLAWISKHREVHGLVTAAHLFDALAKNDECVHEMESGLMRDEWHPQMVYHEHVKADGREKFMVNRTQVLIASVTPTVIPIRDPLATLISYQHRGEKDGRVGTDPTWDPKTHMVDRWVRLAVTSRDVFKNFAHVRFLCWDLLGLMDRFEIVDHLVDISTDLGLVDALPSVKCARNMINNNNLGAYDLKRAYLKGDLDFINENVSNGGVLELMQNTDILRPFLEGLGYSKLMWW